MPYIREGERRHLDPYIISLLEEANGVGEFNYVISRLLHGVLERSVSLNYDQINSLIGVLECAKLEFYRKVAAPFEEKKRKENGGLPLDE